MAALAASVGASGFGYGMGFVKVVTDQPGFYGWGEATLEWHTRGVLGATEDLASLLVGDDPTCVEHLWQMMWRQHFWHGSGVTRSPAIDLALWDIVGKVHGVPCHKQWGGPVWDSIRRIAMVDCHARPSPAMGMQFAKALDPYGLYFFGEPCWPESIEGLAAINAAVTTSIASGERMTHLAAFRDLFAARGCEICQLDLTHCGGFTEARRFA